MKSCIVVYRHLRQKLLNCNSVSLEIIIAILVFGYGVYSGSIIKTIIDGLYFIIILELVRMVVEYIKSNTHRVKLRYLVDAAIIASLRELIILVVDSHHIKHHAIELAIYGIWTFVFIFMRLIVMKVTPDEFESKYKKEFNG